MSRTLSDATVTKIRGVQLPTYDRSALKSRIVHIGCGNFHRSHFCHYLDTLLEKDLTDWGVTEVDILPIPEQRVEIMREQDYLYSLVTKDTDGTQVNRVIGCILGYENAATNPDAVLDLLSSDETHLITLTITEKGYGHDSHTGKLDLQNPAIASDLRGDRPLQSAVGYLCEALDRRHRAGGAALTIMSCDNVPMNGEVLKRCVHEFCEQRYPHLISWLAESVTFPSTMVDRITPQTSDEVRQQIQADHGYLDRWAVHGEAFIQWVIERSFATDLPPFERAGAILTDDVEPYELMKIRLLNGSHSALAYMAYLMGYRYVDDAMADVLLRTFLRHHYMQSISKTLQPIEGIDFGQYMDTLINRFSNRNIRDTVLRLAEDGSVKISNSIAKPLKDLPEIAEPIMLVIASWLRFLTGVDEAGEPILLQEPNLEAIDGAGESLFTLIGLSSQPQELKGQWTRRIEEQLSVIEELGMQGALGAYLESHTAP